VVIALTINEAAALRSAGPSTGEATPERRRVHVPRDEAKRLTWLNWRSNGCEHGLKRHVVALDGNVQEINDLPRRKPKQVSSRQWGAI
jgi:hypothetical protein